MHNINHNYNIHTYNNNNNNTVYNNNNNNSTIIIAATISKHSCVYILPVVYDCCSSRRRPTLRPTPCSGGCHNRGFLTGDYYNLGACSVMVACSVRVQYVGVACFVWVAIP